MKNGVLKERWHCKRADRNWKREEGLEMCKEKKAAILLGEDKCHDHSIIVEVVCTEPPYPVSGFWYCNYRNKGKLKGKAIQRKKEFSPGNFNPVRKTDFSWSCTETSFTLSWELHSWLENQAHPTSCHVRGAEVMVWFSLSSLQLQPMAVLQSFWWELNLLISSIFLKQSQQ